MTSPVRRHWTLSSSNLIVSPFHDIAPVQILKPPSCLAVHKDDISREQLKELLYEEIMSFRPAPIV